MNNVAIETQTLSSDHLINRTSRTDGRSSHAMDHDIHEIAVGFGQHFGNRLKGLDFGTTTSGEVTFRRVDPLRDPFQVADTRLQTRLESLCETLRAKY
jgi:hypothetical protein